MKAELVFGAERIMNYLCKADEGLRLLCIYNYCSVQFILTATELEYAQAVMLVL